MTFPPLAEGDRSSGQLQAVPAIVPEMVRRITNWIHFRLTNGADFAPDFLDDIIGVTA
jgi:hypothetical protein